MMWKRYRNSITGCLIVIFIITICTSGYLNAYAKETINEVDNYEYIGDINRIDEKKYEIASPKIVGADKGFRMSSTKQIVNFRTKSSTTNFIEVGTGTKGYVHGSYGADAAYLGTENGKVKFMLSGVIGLVDEEEVEVLSLSSVKSWSSYYVNNNNLYHGISTDMTTPGYYYSINNGPAPSYLKTGIEYFSYDGHFFYVNYDTMLEDYRNNTRNHAVNSNEPFYNYYQYLPLRSKTSYSGETLNRLINSQGNVNSQSKMYNIGLTMTSMQNTYGVNALLMSGVAANESAWGTSNIAKTKNNLFGLNAVDSSPGESANYYSDVKVCVKDFAETYMSKRYLRPGYQYCFGAFLGNKASGINVKYASDPYWGEKAAQHAYTLDSLGGNKDYLNYSLGIKDSMSHEHTGLNVRKEATTNSTIIYTTARQSQYSFILLNNVTTNGFYKVQSEPVLNSSRTAINTESGIYNFDEMYSYVSSDYVDLISSSVESFDFRVLKTGHKTVELEWNTVNGVDGYAIYKEDGDGIYNKVTSLGQNVTKYADNQCTPNTKYTYRIMTYEWNGSKYVYSDPVYVTATTMGYEPDKVENVHVYNTTNNSIWLGWDSDWEKYADGYNVYRSETKDGEYVKIGTVAKGKASYADYDIEHGKTYYYYVKAYSQANEDTYEGTASNIYQYTPNLIPGKTNSLRIYKVTAGSQWLGWNDATKTSGYVVYRKEGVKGTYEKVETVTGGKTAWADYDLEHGKTYYYYVRAYNAVNGKYYYGAISNTISYTVNFVPGETTNLRIYNSTETSRWLGWNDATKAEGYVVYKREGTKGTYEKIETVTGGKTSWADYDIEKGKTYQYYVRSYAGVQGAYYYGKISNIITVKVN